MNQEQKWSGLLLIQVGGALCLPVIMVGQALGQMYGLMNALLMIFLGNALLLIYALFAGKMAVTERKSTVECAIDRFGKSGAHLFGAVFLCSMLGWFAIQITVISESIVNVLAALFPHVQIPSILLNVFLGLLMTVVSCLGISGLHRLSQITTPLLVGTLAVAFSLSGEAVPLASPILSYAGVSIVMATAIGAVIDIPTYFRHAKTTKDGTIAIVLLFGIALPLIEGVGVYLGMHTSQEGPLAMLTQQGGFFWNLWVSGFLFLAGWMTNNANLYSAGTNSSSLFPKSSFIQRTFCMGVLGTILSCMDLLAHFTSVLEILGILIASVGSVTIVSYFTARPVYHYLACAIGALVGLGSFFGFSLTGAPVVDALLSGAIATVILRRKYEASFYS